MRNEQYCFPCMRYKKKSLFPLDQNVKRPKCISCLEISKEKIDKRNSVRGTKRILDSYKTTKKRYTDDKFQTPEEYQIDGNYDESD